LGLKGFVVVVVVVISDSATSQQSALTIRHQQAAVTGKWPNHHDNDSLQT